MTAAPTSLPPRQRLAQVVASLRRRLPGQLDGLLAHPRFTAGREALARLDEAAVGAAIAAMSPEEAAAIAAALLERWAWLADVELEPHAAIVHPDEIWIGSRPIAIPLSIEVGDGVSVDEVVWDGAVPGPGSITATATAAPPADDRAVEVAVRAHLRARTAAGRCVLVASARIAIRQPRLTVGDDRRRVLAADHAGRPAVGVALGVGTRTVVTGPGGLAELDAPIAPGTALTLAGIPAGKV